MIFLSLSLVPSSYVNKLFFALPCIVYLALRAINLLDKKWHDPDPHNYLCVPWHKWGVGNNLIYCCTLSVTLVYLPSFCQSAVLFWFFSLQSPYGIVICGEIFVGMCSQHNHSGGICDCLTSHSQNCFVYTRKKLRLCCRYVPHPVVLSRVHIMNDMM